MTVLLFIGGVLGGAFIVIARALLVDEASGRIRRRVKESVEATIVSLPRELQEEWAEEWRADLDELLSMPLTALIYVRNLRAAARELVGEWEPVPAPTDASAPFAGRARRLLHGRAQRASGQPWANRLARVPMMIWREVVRGIERVPTVVALGVSASVGVLMAMLGVVTIGKIATFASLLGGVSLLGFGLARRRR